MIKKFLLLIFLLSSVHAQSVETVIQKVQNKFESLTSFSSQIVRVNSEGKVVFKGKFFYYNPNLYKIVLPQRKIIAIADTIWNFEKQRKRVVISPKGEGTSFFDIRAILFREIEKYDFKLLKPKGKGDEKFVLKIVRKGEKNAPVIFVGIGKDYFVNSLRILRQGAPEVEFDFTDVLFNKVKKEKVFKIKIPSDWKVIDLR